MSEFKFACPVCGQHITADSSAAGSRLDCPTCFRKIVVPQAPSSADPKFVLSAAEANKPRPPPAGLKSVLEPMQTAPARGPLPAALVAVLLLICAAGATLFLLRGKIFKHHEAVEADGDLPADEMTEAGSPFEPGTNQVAWALDLADAAYPEGPASGRIRGRNFVYERAILQGGTLTLRHGRSGTTDLGVSIYFFAKQAEELGGKTLSVTTNNTRSPMVRLRWKDGEQARTESLRGDYALKLEFGNINAGRIPGKIYVCLSDGARSCVAGTFSAEVRKPSPPRPVAPKAN